ncbi:hypothetical protein K503DRAFT_846947 [Rhizopogon vinicolor AM-OR11-026]|uniref:Oxidized purine nucleoside triphosphate hydrolase n=1 Tax=Rhizopogon vinicolor AM-OR11-026 TaxID=1314800 RepID=A0A1B7NFV2_9AGAM|nr:hypothetical protein K503DRAFT_846947 [Rhizopogon vinicolor AM-OR11-026]
MTSALPPGLEGNLVEYVRGGEGDWLPFDQKRFYTNAFVIQGDKILLGWKKRGFGVNKYNGFGGKVELGETPAEAAMRELKEEAGIVAPLEHAGSLLFMTKGAGWAFQIEIFSARSYSGIPIETDEMRPEWFSFAPPASGVFDTNESVMPIPYEKMWDDDVYWLPLLVQGRKFVGRADFVMEGDEFKMARHWFGTIKSDH